MAIKKRQIIEIDEEKCNGCGKCVLSCAEGAIQIVDGKAKLVSESYCDGLGACIGDCPQDAIRIVEREAEEFDEAAVEQHLRSIGREPAPHAHDHHAGGCPSAVARSFERETDEQHAATPTTGGESALTHWPVQLHLINPAMPFFKGANLLIAADCVPVAYGSFHADFLRGHKVIIACPKLDDPTGYVEKITALIDEAEVSSIKIVHMEVPCCFGLVRMVQEAASKAGRRVPIEQVIITVDGEIKLLGAN